MRESLRDLPRSSQALTISVILAFLAAAVFGLPQSRLAPAAGLIVIFAAAGLVSPLPYSSGGLVFPTTSVRIVAALLWAPHEVLLGAGIGFFLGLRFFRRNELWRSALNGAGWGLASGAAAFVAQQVIHGSQPGLATLSIAALLAVATNRVTNESIFSMYRAQRFGRPFFPEWLHSIMDQWFSQILVAPTAITLAAIAGRMDGLWWALGLTAISVLALPIPRQELAYYHRAQQMQDEIVEAMVRSLEGVDPTARAHGDRVSALAVETGRRLGMSTRALQALRLSSRLHDVGLLAGQESPSAEEHHAATGARILGRFPDPLIAAFVRAHHERWDGKGLPDQLQGIAIPLGARILAAAEIYDSAVAGMPPFKAPLTRHAAFSYLISLAGTVLDPRVVVTLLGVASEQKTEDGVAG